jgi:hypothetical protein
MATFRALYESEKEIGGAYSDAGLLRQASVDGVLARARADLGDKPTAKQFREWLPEFRKYYPIHWVGGRPLTKAQDTTKAGLKKMSASERLAWANAEAHRKMMGGKS